MTATIHASTLRVAVLVTVALAAGCGGGAPSEQAPAQPAVTRLDSIDIGEVRSEPIRSGPRIAGTLEPRVRSVVRAEVGGSVLEVRAELGQAVEAGDLLARIEARTLREAFQSSDVALRAAREDLQVAELELQRISVLTERGTLPAREREAAHSRVEAARARVSAAQSGRVSARAAVGDATVDAPIAGVISEDAVDAGDVVAPGAHLFTVIDPTSMRLEASVPSSFLGALSIGTPVEFEVRGYPDRQFTGTIERIAPVADPVTRQITILVGIPNEGGELIAGLFAEGRVVAQQRDGLTVPTAALQDDARGATVARVRDDVVARVPVEVGIRDEATDRVEVEGDLAAGDVVLVGPVRNLTAGARVMLPAADAPAQEPPRAGAEAPAEG